MTIRSFARGKMMKVGIAGTNGFAQYLAHYLEESTAHQFFIISQKNHPALARKGWQIVQTSYESLKDLTYLLKGVDVLISTIVGPAQLKLIDAAAAAQVGRFVPSEFRGSPSQRDRDDPSDDGRIAAMDKLMEYERKGVLSYTVFTCGIFYDRFAPDGLACSQIDTKGRFGGEGSFLVNMRKCCADVPVWSDPSSASMYQRDTYICLTSARDTARFMIAALDVATWPQEFKFYGCRLAIRDIILICQKIRGLPFTISTFDPTSIRGSISYAKAIGDTSQYIQLTQKLYTAQDKFDFTQTNLQSLVRVECQSFEDWLREAWAPVLQH